MNILLLPLATFLRVCLWTLAACYFSFIVACASDKSLKKTSTSKKTLETITQPQTTVRSQPQPAEQPPALQTKEAKATAPAINKQINSATKPKSRKLVTGNSDSSKIGQVRAAYQNGAFNEVLSLTVNSTDPAVQYYRAMTRFAMMGYKHHFASKQLHSYRDETIELLSSVIDNPSTTADLHTRARLWLAVALDLNYTAWKNKNEALVILREVKNDKRTKANYYNDALMYEAELYARMGHYPKARRLYKQLAKTPYTNDPVYDYVRKRHETASVAAANGLTRLQRYMDGTHSEYKTQTSNGG